jgi:hypothetical protein
MMFKYLRNGIVTIGLLFSWVGMAQAAETFSDCMIKGNDIAACDVSFTKIPTFGEMCGGATQIQIYTIENNTPVNMKLTSIEVLNINGTVNPDATIVTAPTPNCGTSLAPGAQCNIEVQLTPPVMGEVFDLELVIGVDSRQEKLTSIISVDAIAGCNVAFDLPNPTFPNMCVGGVAESETFSITNNSAVSVDLDSVSIARLDTLDASTTATPVGPCTIPGNLGAGDTCEITVTVTPGLDSGTIDRTLQIVANDELVTLTAPIGLDISSTCDFTFNNPIPVPVNVLCGVPQVLTYIVQNNTPSTETFDYALSDGDTLPAAVITGSCGSSPGSLAAGANCTIIVTLPAESCGATPGIYFYDRTLTVTPTNMSIPPISGAPITTSVLVSDTTPPLPPSDYLTPAGRACAVLAGSTVTNVLSAGTVVTNGSVCVSPGTAITGFPPGDIVPPLGQAQQYTGSDTVAVNAEAALGTAITTLSDLTCTDNLTGQDLGDVSTEVDPLVSGVYCFNTSAELTNDLYLTGTASSVFVFQIGSTLTTASGAQVILEGDVLPENIYWVVGTSATLGTTTMFEGNILAAASITLNTGATLEGRALAEAAVTLDSNPITAPPFP